MMTKVLLFVIGLLVIGTSGQRRRPPPKDLTPPEPPLPPSPARTSGSLSGSSVSGPEITIISQEMDINPDGSFKLSYETSDGTQVQETGSLKNEGTANVTIERQGSAQWKSPDGELVNLSWKAGENGVVFDGDHLPTPPPTQPIPTAIQRALDWIAKNAGPESEEA